MKSLIIRTTDISMLSIFVAFLCVTNGELLNTNNVVIYYLPFLLCLGSYVLEILLERKMAVSTYIMWRIVLLCLFIISALYAVNTSSSIVSIKRYLLQTIVVLLISKKCFDSRENIKSIIKICIAAIAVNLVYVFLTVDIVALEMGQRLGVSTLNEAWNANSIGLMASYAMVFAIYYYLFFYTNRTLKGRLLFIALLGFFGIAMILSGSRKAMLIVVVSLLCYLMVSSKSHIIRNLIIALAVVAIIIYLLFNVPFLYDNIGYRFDTLFSMIQGTGGDKSVLGRQDMVEVGLRAFWNRPIFGYGINCFKDIYGSVSGRVVYAHNNYIELMVDVGIVGVAAYYGYLLYILVATKKRTKDLIFAFSLLLSILVTDYGIVSYYDGFIQYVLCVVICILYTSRNNCENNNASLEVNE